MKRFLKPKWLSLYLIVLADLFLLPSLIQLPLYIIKFKMNAIDEWFADFNIFRAIQSTLHNTDMLKGWLTLQFIVLVLVVLIFGVTCRGENRVLDGVGGPEAPGSGQFGTSRWMTDKEVNKSATLWILKQLVLSGGIVLGAVLDGRKPYALVDTSDSNTIIIGATRSGKTRRLIFPSIYMLAHAGESMIVTDPKGELYDRSATFRRTRVQSDVSGFPEARSR